MAIIDKHDWPQRIERELRGNILPFWVAHTVDAQNGGFYGALSNDLRVLNDVPRSAVVCARVLWTYAAAYRLYGDPAYLRMSRHAYDYLTHAFWDGDYGGVYWAVDAAGRPVNDRKHTYAQAFSVYGLAEYYRATGEAESLELAQQIFHLIERHSFDAINLGNIECRGRAWEAVDDMRLSHHEPNCRKSMNTLLHVMEAYRNLLRVWDVDELRVKLAGLVGVFLERVIDPHTHHLRLFFDDEWRPQPPAITSFGHDIEASWLLVEAAEVMGNSTLGWARDVAVRMADTTYREALEPGGGVAYEVHEGRRNDDRHWWVHAEAVVGLYNAYQLSEREEFALAAHTCWEYIERHFVDRTHGDWFKILDSQGRPYDHHKIGPWECPYHHARACFEMLGRLKG
ncbi:MAG: AGE family epimerase/isomerase [Thermoflexales bacterium]|nr:AGE family epimerase/isomerase [Thermoflexales bacterium]